MTRVGTIRTSDEYSNRIFMSDLAPESAHGSDDEFLTTGSGVPTGWTEYDPGDKLTMTVGDYGLEFTTTATTQSMSGIYKAVPAGDFSAITHVEMNSIDIDTASGISGGIMLLEDTTDLVNSNVYTISLQYTSNASAIIVQSRNAYNSAPSNVESINGIGSTHLYFKFRRISTDWYFDYSEDGKSWSNILVVAQPYTPTGIGPLANKTDTKTGDVYITYPFFRFSTDTALKTPCMGRWARILLD